MPPVEQVLETALYVDDLERSARFYESVFGFERIDSGERLIAMSVRERQVLLLSTEIPFCASHSSHSTRAEG